MIFTSRTQATKVKHVLIVFTLTLGFSVSCADHQKPESPKIVVLGEDSSNLNAIQSLASGFQSKTGVVVSFDKSSFEDSSQKASQDLMRGTGLYDVLLQYNFSLSSFVLNDWVENFDDLQKIVPNFASRRSFESDLFPNAWREVGYFTKPGTNTEVPVGYPFAANTMLLTYNRSMFEDPASKNNFQKRYRRPLTAPKNWQEFRDVAEFFTNPAANTHGVVLEGATDGWLYYEWASIAYNMGGGVFRKVRGWEGDLQTPVLLDSPESIQAARYYKALKPFNTGDFFATGGVQQREIMKRGNVAMALMWSDYLWPLVNDREGSRFAFAPIPGTLSGLAGGSFFINKQSKFKKEAADFILYLLQKDNQIELAKHGLCSPLKSVYDDAEVRKQVPYAEALSTSLSRGVYFYEAGPDANADEQIITKWLQSVWRGDVEPDVALRKAKTEMQSARQQLFSNLSHASAR